MDGPEQGHDYGNEMLYKYHVTCLLASTQPFKKEHPGLQLAGTLFSVLKSPFHPSCT